MTLSKKERFNKELKDTYKRLSINPVLNQKIEFKDHINILMWTIDPESLTLAKWISLIMKEFQEEYESIINLIFIDWESEWSYLFDWEWFNLCESIDIYTFCIHEDYLFSSYITGNTYWFKRYTENKVFTDIILRMNNIDIPKELIFYKKWNILWNNESKIDKIKDIIWDNGSFVLKPHDGKCWNWVYILTESELDNDFYKKYISGSDTLIVQEKIDSYPIEIDSIQKEFNLRVLISFDYIREEYISLWIVWRIGNKWGVINISSWAEYITFEKILLLIWLSNLESEKLRNQVEYISSQSVEVIANKWLKYSRIKDCKILNRQILSWVDIIIDKELNPIIIEVNASSSGGVYELVRKEGIDSISSLVDSILFKTTYFYKSFYETHYKVKKSNI